MNYETWRQRAAPIIAHVITEVGTQNQKTLRAALRDAYPFGLRKHYPYKVWLDEIRRQLSPHQQVKCLQPGNPDQLSILKENETY